MTSNVPKIRFEGYDGEWGKTSLKEVSKELDYGIGASAVHFDGKNNYIRITDIDDETRRLKKMSLTSPDASIEELEGYLVNQNDILFARTGASVGKTYIHKELKGDYFFAGFLIRARICSNFNADFIFQTTRTKKYFNFVNTTSQRSGQPGINAKEYAQFPIYAPILSEQQAIGSFFKELDDRITLQQTSLERLKETKEGVLQKMFPKKGETVPEIRFDGFDGEWDLKKLDDISIYRRGSFPQPYGKKEWYDGEGAMPFVQVIDVTKNMELVKNTKQKISKIAQMKSIYTPAGTVIVTLQGSIGRVAITQYDSYVDRTILIFETYKIEIENKFFSYVIQNIFKIEKRKAPGAIIKTITKKALSSFVVAIPILEEQRAIGSFFKELDDRIAIEERELELLKETKKAFLQKMFV